MAYDLKWLDEDRRFLRVTPSDPISESEARSLIDQMRTITESPDPFFLILDLRQFDVMKAMSLRNVVEGQTIPRQSEALEKSRVAVIGGGQMVKMGLQMIRGMAPMDLIRAFDQEDAAHRWLDEEARLAGV